MYNIIKNVIKTDNYDLTDIKRKIDTMWLKGSITEEQHKELQLMAVEGANAENSVDILQKIAELEKKIAELEANDGVEPDVGETPEEPVAHPEYVTGKWYYSGDKITYNGAVYECTAPEGTVCVWNPSDYPPYWNKVE